MTLPRSITHLICSARSSGQKPKNVLGGWGFYGDAPFFALIADGRLYFKSDPCNVQEFLSGGLDQWV